MTDRAQTLYDYLLGTVLVLVTIIIVLSLFPQLFGPFTDPVGSDTDEIADRVAAAVIETHATDDGDRVLDLDDSSFDDLEEIRDASGVSFRDVNVTVEDNQRENVIDPGGDELPSGDPAATATRVIRLADNGDCENGCFLIVQVW